MRTVIRRKPVRVSLGGFFSLLLVGAAFLLLVEDMNLRFVGLLAAGTSIAILMGGASWPRSWVAWKWWTTASRP